LTARHVRLVKGSKLPVPTVNSSTKPGRTDPLDPVRLDPQLPRMTNITESLQNFLNNPGLKVASLKGDWGTGKTFLWNKFLRDNRSDLKFRAYSYVSLFGVSDIEDIRRHIFTNFEVLDDKSMTKHLGKLKPLSNILKAVAIPYLNSTSAISSYVERKAVDNFLVCFDDLERKEDGISAASLLGLVSQLKEEQNCKIILIYNESELDEDSRKEIAEYREKVIDLELKYQPTIKDNMAIIWPEGPRFEVEAAFNAVGLNNIRVMQRVKWAFDYFEPVITKNYPNLWSSFIEKIASLVIIYHAYADSLSLDEAMSTNQYACIFAKDKEDTSRFDVLKKLGYFPDKCDHVIAEFINNGYVNWPDRADLLKSADSKSKSQSVNASHRAIWKTFHHNFTTSQADFVDKHAAFLEKHIDDLRLGDVAASVDFIKDLDPKRNLDDLLDKSVANFVQHADRSDESLLRQMRLKPDLIGKFEALLATKKSPYSIKELFTLLAGESGWNPSDLLFFSRYSENQIYDWITTETTVDVIGLLKEFLLRFSSDEKATDAVKKIKAALERIKARSPFDSRRVALIENP
jgi:hypothetical protein